MDEGGRLIWQRPQCVSGLAALIQRQGVVTVRGLVKGAARLAASMDPSIRAFSSLRVAISGQLLLTKTWFARG